MRWVLESVFCGVQILFFSGASERSGVLGESLQLKVIQRIVVVFVVFGSGSDAWGGLWCWLLRIFGCISLAAYTVHASA